MSARPLAVFVAVLSSVPLAASVSRPALAAEAEATCVPLDAWADRTRDDLLGGDLDAARRHLEDAESALACRVATRAELSRYWLYTGALAALSHDSEAAGVAFGSARRLDPEGWDPLLGDALHAAWEAAPEGSPVSVLVDTNASRIVLDGERVRQWPVATDSGRLTVQVLGYRRGEVHDWRIITAPPALETILLETGLPELPPPDRTAQHRRAMPWFIAGATSLATSGGAALYALAERSASGTADTIEEAGNHRSRQLVGAWTTVGLAGTGVLLVGVGAITW